MVDKKTPARFSIQFNLADPRAQAVAELLNQQGRKKAQFITAAVTYYISCCNDSVADLETERLQWLKPVVEHLVQLELEKQGLPKGAPDEESPTKVHMEILKSDIITLGDTEVPVPDSAKEMIADALKAFRSNP